MDTPRSHQLPKPRKKRDPDKNKIQQKAYRQRLYAKPNGIENVKAIHRRRYHERMARLKATGEYEAFKMKKTEEGMRRYYGMSEEKRAEVKRKNSHCQRNWRQRMKDNGTYEAYLQRTNARRRQHAAEKRKAMGEEAWKILQSQRYNKRIECIRRREWSWLDEELERPFPLPWLPLDWAESVPEEDRVQTIRAEAMQKMNDYL